MQTVLISQVGLTRGERPPVRAPLNSMRGSIIVYEVLRTHTMSYPREIYEVALCSVGTCKLLCTKQKEE